MSSSSKASTTSNTTAINQQVGASEGATAIGAGATVEMLSDDVALGSISAIRDTSFGVLDFTKDTTRGAFDLASRTLDINAKVIDTAGDKLIGGLTSQSTAALKAQEKLTEQAITGIERSRQDTNQVLITDIAKYAAAAIAVVTLGVAVIYLRKKKAA